MANVWPSDDERKRINVEQSGLEKYKLALMVGLAAFVVVFLLLVVFVRDGSAGGSGEDCHKHQRGNGHHEHGEGKGNGHHKCHEETTTTEHEVTEHEQSPTTTVVLIPPRVISREDAKPVPVPADPEFTG